VTVSGPGGRWVDEWNWLQVVTKGPWGGHLSNSEVVDDQVAIVLRMSNESLGGDFLSGAVVDSATSCSECGLSAVGGGGDVCF
jgi:hypothetical protein